MKLKQVLATVLISALTTFGMIWGYGKWNQKDMYARQQATQVPGNYKYAGYNDDGSLPPGPVDFTIPAQAAIPTVVHIRTKTNAKQVTNNLGRRQDPFSDFFDDDMLNQLFGRRNNVIPEQRASGSGIIISSDGYIVTNNHVVEDADEVTVTLSTKKTYKAKVIGRDASYDLAVIKIDATNLPFLLYGNSDDVKIGQWVLAIGYPLDLETTVTAGIVSAKARQLGLNKSKAGASAVESYIQTDAAVNRGNSGGALINTEGKLVGINSAIASPTGFYSGYSYAIPVNIAKKVVDDIIKFGTVQRAYLGISYLDVSGLSNEEKKANGIPESAWGIYTQDVPKDGASYAAGIRKGDIIKSLNGVILASGAEMQEQVSRYKPGDKVELVYNRNGKDITTTVTLKNKVGNLEIVKKEKLVDLLGADLETLDPKKAKEYAISGGVVVKKIKEGILNDQTRMRDNFIILKVNNKEVTSVSDLNDAIGDNKQITISGFYPGYEGLYEYPISFDNN